ncbi:MAG: hypothetical protein HFE81_01165 [Bacilli bacterium]|nr:hypothetical protein [Bacilli bacterium]
MQKKLSIILSLFVSLILFAPIKTEAISIKNVDFSNSVLILEDPITSTDEIEDWMDDYDQPQDCDGANSILGDPDDEDSVAWLLQQALNYIKIIGPILVAILSSFDFVQVIVKNDDDAMKKASKKLIYRLILAACLFFIPTLVQAMLDIFGMASDPTCGLH